MVRKVIGNRPFKGSQREKECKGQRRLIKEPRQWDVLTIERAEEKRAMLRAQQQIRRQPQTIALVACAAQKLKTPARAADLYASPLFRRAREYAEYRADAWYILSALHGLLKPERITAPYDFTLKECSKREREQWAWRVLCELRSVAPPNSHIIILAGKLYREHLEFDLTRCGYRVEVPMRGMGIGQQLHFLISQKRAEVS
ncbi:MAG: DUF6884 domain-containing protein [Blastocatellia bacterium]